ncbi:MAG: LysM peptidoglycan-binding domain-containing protein, partial [Cyclobacteriaceae bacterium]
TAKEMGLRVDRIVDERKKIVSSTRAAANYVKKNNARFFDNWLISLQAYQMGPGGALKAGGAKYKGQKSMTIDSRTYWYIKKYLAHKVAFENALNGPAVVSVAEYWNGSNKSFKDISRETGVSEAELETYNKWLERGKIPDDKKYAVIVPVMAAEGLPVDFGSPALASTTVRGVKKSYAFEYEFASPNLFPVIPNRREAEAGKVTKINGRKAIIARKGDRAASLATKGDISLGKFYRFNDMNENQRVYDGEVYYLQRKKSKQAAYHHVVQRGETFWSISQKYGIKKKKLLTRNRLRKDVSLQEGRILWLRYIRPKDVPVEFVQPEPVDVPVIAKKMEKKSSAITAGANDSASSSITATGSGSTKITGEAPDLFADSEDDQVTLSSAKTQVNETEKQCKDR